MTQLSYGYALRWGVPQTAHMERSIVARRGDQVISIREFRTDELVYIHRGSEHHWHSGDEFGLSPQWDKDADLVFLEIAARLEMDGYAVRVGRGTFLRTPTREERLAPETDRSCPPVAVR